MTIAIARDPIYRHRRFQPEIIELCVRWVQRYVPEFEKRWDRYARPVHSSWRMDETAISVRRGTHYLYRAVDKYGKTVASLLCVDRSESQSTAIVTARESRMAIRHGRQPPVSQQHRRAGPSSDQAPPRTYACPEVFSYRGHCARGRGTRAPHSQAPVLVRPRRPAPVFVS
jgi:hypothetical protein